MLYRFTLLFFVVFFFSSCMEDEKKETSLAIKETKHSFILYDELTPVGTDMEQFIQKNIKNEFTIINTRTGNVVYDSRFVKEKNAQEINMFRDKDYSSKRDNNIAYALQTVSSYISTLKLKEADIYMFNAIFHHKIIGQADYDFKNGYPSDGFAINQIGEFAWIEPFSVKTKVYIFNDQYQFRNDKHSFMLARFYTLLMKRLNATLYSYNTTFTCEENKLNINDSFEHTDNLEIYKSTLLPFGFARDNVDYTVNKQTFSINIRNEDRSGGTMTIYIGGEEYTTKCNLAGVCSLNDISIAKYKGNPIELKFKHLKLQDGKTHYSRMLDKNANYHIYKPKKLPDTPTGIAYSTDGNSTVIENPRASSYHNVSDEHFNDGYVFPLSTPQSLKNISFGECDADGAKASVLALLENGESLELAANENFSGDDGTSDCTNMTPHTFNIDVNDRVKSIIIKPTEIGGNFMGGNWKITDMKVYKK